MIAWLSSIALAQIAPACQDVAAADPPNWYVDDQHQQDFLLNYFALATTLSPLHAPIPDAPGHGSVSLELSMIPPLSCNRRLVLSRSKTEETNKTPLLPRPRGTFTFPLIADHWALYGGLAYDPPVTLFGTRNVIASGEAGIGYLAKSGFQMSGRYHYTLMKTVAEIAGPFQPTDPVYLDFFVGSTFGVDVMAGYQVGKVVPYASLGVTDVSTYFWIGDDGVVSNNSTPYFGPAASLGAQGTFGHLVLAGELYTAPNFTFDRSLGQIATARVRVGGTW
jgi:hypothetical protein